MPADAETRALLDEFETQGARSHEQLGVLRARRMVELSISLQGERPPVHAVQDLLVDGPAGRIPVRVIRQPPTHELAPLIVYFHGGGWVTGSVEVADGPCRVLAAATGAVVASVEYRRAPETPFPGPLEDCFAAVQQLVARAEQLGADPQRVIVMGDSAGGGLAAGVTLLSRARGGCEIARQVLLYPVVHPAVGSPFASYVENATGFSLTADAMAWFWSMYVGGDGLTTDPLAAPLLEDDLSGLPPALIVTVELDPLRDEGRAYAARLAAAGVPVEHFELAGTIHGCFWMAGRLSHAHRIADRVAALLTAAWPAR